MGFRRGYDMTEKKSIPFHWGRLIREMGMKGLVAMLANHSEVISYNSDENILIFEIQSSLKNYAEGAGLDKMLIFLKQRFGDDLKLDITYGFAEKSPAMMSLGRRMEKYQFALQDAQVDEFLKEACHELGAKVLLESVQPK